jgi:hypothetical protein
MLKSYLILPVRITWERANDAFADLGLEREAELFNHWIG